MSGQAVLWASLQILDLPTKLNGPMEENAFTISFQDHLTLSGNFIQLKMEKSRGHCPHPPVYNNLPARGKIDIQAFALGVFLPKSMWEGSSCQSRRESSKFFNPMVWRQMLNHQLARKCVELLSLLFSHFIVSDCLGPLGIQHTKLPSPSSSPRICSNSCPLSQWCHPTISSSVIPFSCLQSFPASGSFPMSQLFTSGSQSIGASALASSPINEYSGLISFRMDWFDLLAVQDYCRFQ